LPIKELPIKELPIKELPNDRQRLIKDNA